MGRSKDVLTDERLIAIGRCHGCDGVGLEYGETSARWHRDVEALALYGFGQEQLAAFDADGAEHTRLRAARPDVIATKKNSLRGRDEAHAAAWDWADMVTSAVGVLARKDAVIAGRLAEATPVDDAELAAKLGALRSLLADVGSQLPASAAVADRLAEVNGLIARLTASTGEVHVAKSAAVADTAALDLLDGKLYVAINDLNEAARKAIRNGRLSAELSEYRLHHLRRSGRAAAKEPAPEGGAPVS